MGGGRGADWGESGQEKMEKEVPVKRALRGERERGVWAEG